MPVGTYVREPGETESTKKIKLFVEPFCTPTSNVTVSKKSPPVTPSKEGVVAGTIPRLAPCVPVGASNAVRRKISAGCSSSWTLM